VVEKALAEFSPEMALGLSRCHNNLDEGIAAMPYE